MNVLTFCAKKTLKLVQHSHSCTKHHKTLGGNSGPGLFLSGDQGVYLMSTGTPILTDTNRDNQSQIVYADGCNPVDDKDTWWELKGQTFGSDDGIEYLPVTQQDLKFLEISKTIRIEFENDTLSVKFIKERTYH